MTEMLKVSLEFPRGAYAGGDLGAPEELPSPARVHEAFVAAAAGGPWAQPDGHVLVAIDEHRRAVSWLEEHEPIGIRAPQARLTSYRANRFRWRASPVNPTQTDFEPFSALDGPVTYYWPAPPPSTVTALCVLACEVTHLGRADSTVIATVATGAPDDDQGEFYAITAGRGPGRVMRVPAPGRFAELERAHAATTRPGRHGTGSMGRQAADQQTTGANEVGTVLRRFASAAAQVDWPYDEVWKLTVDADARTQRLLTGERCRVAVATRIHRALVRAIGTDVPSFITGRDGDGPLRGPGHLAIHITSLQGRGNDLVALLGVPKEAGYADRARLADALTRRGGLRCAVPGRSGSRFSLDEATPLPAVPFWSGAGTVLCAETPVALDAPGLPRRGPWTLDDAVVCSVGFAMRGVLERMGLEWGTGWAFRRRLVETLRAEHGVDARARRITDSASRYVHRVGTGDLVVAVDAAVQLGALAPVGDGFLAIGRARHLGGGLLRPIGEPAP